MRALIRKELRELFWPTVIAAGLFAIAGGLRWKYAEGAVLTVLWLIAMPVIGLLMGSQAVAKEMTHRTQEWQNLWPVSRGRWWAAKLVSHFAGLAVGFAVVGLAANAIGRWPSDGPGSPPPLAPLVIMDAGVTLLLFALGVLMSTLRPKSFEALGLALLAGILMTTGWFMVSGGYLPERFGPRLGISSADSRPGAVLAIGIVLGLACLVAAGWAASSTPVMSVGRRNLRGGLAALGLCIAALPCLLLGGLYLSPPETPDFWNMQDVSMSPDGRLIAFTGEKGWNQGNYGHNLWVMDLDGTGPRCVARGPAVWAYKWVPGSHRIVCLWGMANQQEDRDHPDQWLWLLDARHGPISKLPIVLSSSRFASYVPLFVSPKGAYLLVGNDLWDLRTTRQVGTLPVPFGHNLWLWSFDESAIYVSRPYLTGVSKPRGKPIIDRVDLPSCKVVRNVSWPTFGGVIHDGRNESGKPGEMGVAVKREKPHQDLGAVIDGSLPGGGPFLSPDGKWIASYVFHGGRRSRNVNLVVTPAQGGPAARPFVVKGGGAPAEGVVGWTADDQIIRLEDDRRLIELSLDGSEKILFEAAGEPAREERDEGLYQ